MDDELVKIYSALTFVAAEDVDLKRENANIDGDTAMGTMLKYGSEGSKQFYQMFVMKPEHARAHTSGISTSMTWTLPLWGPPPVPRLT